MYQIYAKYNVSVSFHDSIMGNTKSFVPREGSVINNFLCCLRHISNNLVVRDLVFTTSAFAANVVILSGEIRC